MTAVVTTPCMMSDHWISAPTVTASLNGTGTTEAEFPMNQNKTALARVLKVTKTIDMGHTLYIQNVFIHNTL